MQKIFATNCSIQEYVEKGRAFSFPKLPLCPCCKLSKPYKHGFYRRFCLDGDNVYRILIRRYYCLKCKTTISFLPDFCLPTFQHSINIIEKVLWLRFGKERSLKQCAKELLRESSQLCWSPQKIRFYASRFFDNLPWIEVLLRNIFPQINLDLHKEKRAKKVLATIRSYADGFKGLTRLLHEQCQRSFLAPLL